MTGPGRPSTHYSICEVCGHKDEGVVALFFGHRCDACGAVDAARLRVTK